MRLQQLAGPQPGPDQVVVAVEAVGVNPVDAGNRSDPSWAGVNPPYVVGYEVAGRIQAVGDGGAGGPVIWCGACSRSGAPRWGTYAELVALDAALVGPRPPGLSAVQAASLPLAGATGVQLLDRLAPRPGEWVLVHGAAGGVGSLFVQLARARGARVVASASAQREALLRELGAEVFLDRHAGQVAERAQHAIGQELDMVADWSATGCWRPASRWCGRVAGQGRSWSWRATLSLRWIATSPCMGAGAAIAGGKVVPRVAG